MALANAYVSLWCQMLINLYAAGLAPVNSDGLLKVGRVDVWPAR